jgi:hypothetical protein
VAGGKLASEREKNNMPAFIVLLITLFLMASTSLAQERFSEFRKIEAYEVRPGVLMMPYYTATNEICQIGLERLQYSPTLIRLNLDLSREEVLRILDELVPADERGKLVNSEKLIRHIGQSMKETTTKEYENLVIIMHSVPFPVEGGSTMKDIVATITWKNRKCRAEE